MNRSFRCYRNELFLSGNMEKQIPVINGSYFLYKHERHKGWVYVLIDDAKKVKGKYPKLKVKGSIDGYPLSNIILASYGKEGYVLPVRSEIRTQIKKDDGDKVKVVLYKDSSQLEIPEELDMCLSDEPKAQKFFDSLSESEKRMYTLWISSAKKSETRADRIAKSIERLKKGLKLYEKKKQ
jgi:hypothetical protein